MAGFLLLVVGAASRPAPRAAGCATRPGTSCTSYTYLAVALAFGHQFADGADFTGDRAGPARLVRPLRRGGGAAGLVPVRRARCAGRVRGTGCGSPRSATRRRASSRSTSPGRGLDGCGAEPGQFFRWRFLTRELWWAANPYSLSAAPHRGVLRITVKAAGDHSAALARLRPGTRVLAEGPYGAFTATPPAAARKVAADRRRRRHHPAARPVRDAARAR